MKENIELLIEQNKNLIYKIASKYSGYYDIEDLFQVGVIGLLKASKNFINKSNAMFSTYAYKYILGEIIEFIKNDRTIKVSDEYIKIYKSYEKTKDFLTSKLNRNPSIIEISAFMNIDINFLENVIKSCEFTVSLDNELNDEEFSLNKVVGRDTQEEIDNYIDLKNEIDKLSILDRELIELRYFKDYTQSETAKIMNMSQVQVSRNETKILSRIKNKIAV